jgi:hypothetical protein
MPASRFEKRVKKRVPYIACFLIVRVFCDEEVAGQR